MSAEISDGDLVRLARDGDQVAFRLLVERHQPMARARAWRLCPNPSDVDDIVQDSFLQAFIALDRLRDPDRFAGWLAGIVLNVAYLTEHRPDLVPAASRRTHMTAIRVARVERRIPPGPVPIHHPSYVVVLADDAGHRELPIWLLADDGLRLSQLIEPPTGDHEQAGAAQARTEDELTDRLLRAADASVTGVDLDELGPQVTAARIALASPAGTRQVTARLAEGLAIAITAGAPVRVADTVMDRLAVPLPSDNQPVPLPEPTPALAVLRLGQRPRYQPRNLAFADGLDGWQLGGSFTDHASHSHWGDYAGAAEGGIAVLSSAVPQPAGFAFLGQEIYADDYRGAMVTFRGQFRTEDTAGSAGLFLRIHTDPRDLRGPLTEHAASVDPDNNIVTIAGHRDWTSHEVTARVPDDANIVMFGMFLAGRGRIELRHPELTRNA